MASISSLGIGSGLDLGSLVTNLVNAERAPVDARLNRNETNLTTDLSGVGLMRSALAGFQNSLSVLDNASSFSSRKATNSDTGAFSLSVSNDAQLGSYDIDVNNLASAQSLASKAYSGIDSIIGTGSIEISFGAITGPGFTSFAANPDKAIQTITVDATNNTLSGLKDHINSNDFGVTAAIVNDGSGYRLTLQSKDSGANSAMQITVTDSGDGDPLNADGLSALAYNASAQNMTQTREARNASLSINGLPISSADNTLSEAIQGVTINLLAETTTTARVSVSDDNSQISSAVRGVVEGFNEMISTLNDLSSSNTESGRIGTLAGDAMLRSFTSQVRNILTSPVAGLDGGVRALADIGIRTQLDGTMQIDSARLNEAISESPLDVLSIFAPIGQPSDSLVGFQGFTDDTRTGNYAVNVTTLATQGLLTGNGFAAPFPAALVIGAGNDDFAVTVDGVSSGSIALTQGNYTSGAALATEIQLRINSAQLIRDAGKSVTVTYDSASSRFLFKSAPYGSSSSIVFNSVDTTMGTDLGLTAVSGVDGVDVAGSVGGVNGIGEGQILTIEDGDPEGMSLLVQGVTTGGRGNVKFVRGMTEQLNALLDSYLGSDGSITAREESINASLEDIADQREALELRIDSLQARLVSQFTALDALVANFQTTGNFLAQQIANLPGSGTLLNNDN
jgi:flagellar hook-associated protein 2